jgi:hypothetical protein
MIDLIIICCILCCVTIAIASALYYKKTHLGINVGQTYSYVYMNNTYTVTLTSTNLVLNLTPPKNYTRTSGTGPINGNWTSIDGSTITIVDNYDGTLQHITSVGTMIGKYDKQ